MPQKQEKGKCKRHQYFGSGWGNPILGLLSFPQQLGQPISGQQKSSWRSLPHPCLSTLEKPTPAHFCLSLCLEEAMKKSSEEFQGVYSKTSLIQVFFSANHALHLQSDLLLALLPPADFKPTLQSKGGSRKTLTQKVAAGAAAAAAAPHQDSPALPPALPPWLCISNR